MRTVLALVLVAGCGSSAPAPAPTPAPSAVEPPPPAEARDYVGLQVRDGRTDIPAPFEWMGETLLGDGDSVDRAVTYGREGDATVILLERVDGWEPIPGGRAPIWEVVAVTRLPGRLSVLLDCEVDGTLDPWVVGAAAADAQCGAAAAVAHAFRGTPSSAELAPIPTGGVRCPLPCTDEPE